MKYIKNQVIFSLFCGLFFSGAVLADPPKPNVFDGGNKWLITFHNDPTGNQGQWATQEICFLPYSVVGTSIQGVWYSTSFFDWNGLYYQEGDEVKMTGDYARNAGHDHMTLQHTTFDEPGKVRGMALKDWTEWREDKAFGRIIGWGNTKLVRAGRCKIPTNFDSISDFASSDLKELEYETLKISQSIPERLTVKGSVANYPGQQNLESLDDYAHRTGVK